jgi:hypothetical protein
LAEAFHLSVLCYTLHPKPLFCDGA